MLSAAQDGSKYTFFSKRSTLGSNASSSEVDLHDPIHKFGTSIVKISFHV